MPITNYATLVTALDGTTGWSHRGDITARIPEFIALAEADMQVRCKLVDFEATGTVAVVAGVGALPADFNGMRSVYWDGDVKTPLRYVVPDRFDSYRNDTGDTPNYYTISGASLLVNQAASGNAKLTYQAKFTAISGAVATNALITNFPDVYLHGTLAQIALWAEDDVKAQRELSLMDAVVNRIRTNNADRKYAGGTLQVRPR